MPVRPTLQVIGRRLEAEHHRLRDFLTRAAQPHEWHEAGSPEADELLRRQGSAKRVAGAVGEGAMAVALAHRRLAELDAGVAV